MDGVVETTQQPAPAVPAAPAVASVETSPQPEQDVGAEGTETKVETEETPQKRESRRARQLNRERERRIAAETELRIYREQQARQQQPKEAPADDSPRREQFDTYEEYIEARATHRAEKAAEERARKVIDESKKGESEAKQRETQERQAREWNARIEKARDAVEDFDEVCSESEAVVTQPMAAAIQESDQGALIAYYLAKNPAEAERISKLSASKQAAAIVGLEEKVAKPTKQLSKAPDPINPVGKKADVANKDPAKMTDEEYAKWRQERRARR
ncbi:MAG: hypothetical protein ACYC2K_01605 [Gemmatimonadales bacterium]